MSCRYILSGLDGTVKQSNDLNKLMQVLMILVIFYGRSHTRI